MLRNYLRIAFANIRRSARYSIINMVGLALGISCAMIIFALVSFHLSYDNFHRDLDRIYRFVTEEHMEDIEYDASVPPPFGKAFREDYTFGEQVARLCTQQDNLISIGSGPGTRKFKENIGFVEYEFFDIFHFPLVSGAGNTTLTEPNTAIIDEQTASKLFGDKPAIGETFRLNNSIDIKITGVLKDFPRNTDYKLGIFISWATIAQHNPWYASDNSWNGITDNIQTFVRLRPGISAQEVENVLPAYVKKYRAESKNVHVYKLQPLSDVHFNPKYAGKISKTILVLLSVTAFLLVFTACLNFINLATAQAINRAREVGVRKSLGSTRRQLFWQFTLETGTLVTLSATIAYVLAYSALPYLNALLDTHFSLDLSDYRLLLFTGLMIVAVTFMAGAYPSFVLARFKPVVALKGKSSDRQRAGFNLRRLLITTQFTIAQVLLIGLIVFIYQMKNFRNADMGFDRHAIIMIPVGSQDVKMTTLKTKFLAIPQVEQVALCFGAPASENNWTTMIGFDNRQEREPFAVNFKCADEDYMAAFGLELVAGRNLLPADTIREFLVNETMVRKLGVDSNEEILGRNLHVNGVDAPVIGVIRDFHAYSLRDEVTPVVLATRKTSYETYAVRINMAGTREALTTLQKSWTEMYPEQYYTYEFLDDEIGRFYDTESMLLKVVIVFSFIALAIASMGLYGLVSFMAVQRTKEIGIRKVLGGNVSDILWLFGKEFIRLVIVAFFLAAPVGWWLTSTWLQHYAYHVHLHGWIFLLEIGLIGFIVILTVGFESIRAATRNPVDSLRAE